MRENEGDSEFAPSHTDTGFNPSATNTTSTGSGGGGGGSDLMPSAESKSNELAAVVEEANRVAKEILKR